nr:IclR family transcriptional regulator [uncultured Gellertiella sp.]
MSTVGKAMALLDAFDLRHPDLGLTEIARAAGYDKATTRRLLIQLCAHGMIEHDAVSRRYRLGPALVRLARIREAHFPFIEIARPFVQQLADTTGETTHLSEFDCGYLNSTFVAESARANRVSVSVGARLPLNGTASGLAFLAHAPEAYVEHYLAGRLESHTRFTLTDPEKVRTVLGEVRERGYSISVQGHEEGVYSTGAAIFGRERMPIGAVAIACPLVRTDEDTGRRFGEAVRRIAAEISSRLSGRSTHLPRQFRQSSPHVTKAGA